MPVSESQRKANAKYFAKNYSQVKLSMPNDEAAALETFCKDHGYTKAGFIRRAVAEKMEREGGQPVASEQSSEDGEDDGEEDIQAAPGSWEAARVVWLAACQRGMALRQGRAI